MEFLPTAIYVGSSHFLLIIHLGTCILFSWQKHLDLTRLKLVKKLNEAMEKEQKKAQALELEAEKKTKGLSLKDRDITAAFDANDDWKTLF